MLCTRCGKRPAVVFVSNNNSKDAPTVGYCLTCAKELGIKPVEDLISKMAAFVGHIASLDFIPPCTAGQELKGVSPEEWHELFREIIDHSSYEVVILDIGSGLNHLDDFLTECDVIYMPVANDIYADAKLASFETFLRLSGSERIAGRIRQIRLGETELPGNRDRYLQQIVWSGIGDHARDCIIRDGL